MYKGSKVVAWVWEWEEMNDRKNKMQTKKQVVCHLYRLGSNHQPLNLGECNDGSPFTGVNQAVNQAKEYVDVCEQLGL